jgi:malate dehydrogenase (oxaloacetate-decarboxylating)
VQWEDFATPHARPLLERYRDELLTFNDDIQGTAAVALGAILGAVGVTGKRLRDQQIVFLGAGSAAVGVADYLRAALVQDGLAEAEARGRFWLIDKGGLLHTGRTDLTPEQCVYAQSSQRVAGWPRTSHGASGLADVIGRVEATILIGLSTVAGAFTEPIVAAMAAAVDRPIILPLSNPTAKAEAVPEDLIRWTDGRVLVATGSPFPPVEHGGVTYRIAQANNALVFPGLGLGVTVARAARITDGMITAAAEAVAGLSDATTRGASLLPPVTDLRMVSAAVAIAVAHAADKEGLAQAPLDDPVQQVHQAMWRPQYPSFEAI